MEKELGARIRAVRKREGKKAVDVAKAIGVSQSHFANMEGGQRRISAEHVRKVARYLKISVQELYAEKETRIHVGDGVFLTREDADLLREALVDPGRALQFRACLRQYVQGSDRLRQAIDSLLQLADERETANEGHNPGRRASA